tara:strand:+ start:118 stop:594 length:477 start_codon:yes stop_codon:yes gene_type:complete
MADSGTSLGGQGVGAGSSVAAAAKRKPMRAPAGQQGAKRPAREGDGGGLSVSAAGKKPAAVLGLDQEFSPEAARFLRVGGDQAGQALLEANRMFAGALPVEAGGLPEVADPTDPELMAALNGIPEEGLDAVSDVSPRVAVSIAAGAVPAGTDGATAVG